MWYGRTLKNLSSFSLNLRNMTPFRTIQTSVNERAVVAVLFPVYKQHLQAVSQSAMPVGKAATAILWEIRVCIVEGVPVLSWIVLQSALGRRGLQVVMHGDGLVSLLQWALAVPAVARVMQIPEGVIHWQHQPLLTILSVGVRMTRREITTRQYLNITPRPCFWLRMLGLFRLLQSF